MKRETGLALVLSAVIAVPLAAVPVQAAAPAEERRAPSIRVTPDPALIRADRATWLDVTADFEGPRDFYEDVVLVEMKADRGVGYNYLNLTDPENDGVWTGRIKFDAFNAVPGTWRVESSAIDEATGDDVEGPAGTFSFRAATRLAVTVKSKVVHKGGKLKVGGGLRGVAVAGGYEGLARQRVKIYYRPAGRAKWVLAAGVKTNGAGRFTKVFRPKKGGSLRLVWPGDGRYAPAKSKIIKFRVG
ncbi:hypothetical protein [Actinocorallia populi]|uniref:hypothetical protein n=1 Tax=Actinocorallia populi TaxID=2079200 RepID=UPI0018E58BE2|nr:hypothetical protein [Actinocorallia populi]